MGVKGLMTYCRENLDSCSKKIDLVQLAKLNGGIEILVDYLNFEGYILPKIWFMTRNPYVQITGAEYALLDEVLRTIVTTLSSVGIRLRFYVDGARGASPRHAEQKFDVWVERHKEHVQKLDKLLEVCRGEGDVAYIRRHDPLWPILGDEQIIPSLRAAGAEVVHATTGDGDSVMALHLAERKDAVGILSNDSDFCLFKFSRVIPMDTFDLFKELNLHLDRSSRVKTVQPTRLLCPVIHSSLVASRLFQFPCDMVTNETWMSGELAIIAGNDYTGHLVIKDGFYEAVGLERNRRIEDVATWIRQYGHVDNHPFIAAKMRADPEFLSAVAETRAMYALSFNEDVPEDRTEVSRFIEDKVLDGSFNCRLLGIHHGMYWHKVLLEDRASYGCVELHLQPLRKYLYALLGCPVVTEYGLSADTEQFETLQVKADHNLSRTDEYLSIDRNTRLGVFHQVMTDRNPQAVDYFGRYGERDGFLCYVLRYLLKLSRLSLCRWEFEALFASICILRNKPDDSRKHLGTMTRLPKAGVTIAGWFQDVFRHAVMLGELLHVGNKFPAPRYVFSGATFTAFYTNPPRDTRSTSTREERRMFDDIIQNHQF